MAISGNTGRHNSTSLQQHADHQDKTLPRRSGTAHESQLQSYAGIYRDGSIVF